MLRIAVIELLLFALPFAAWVAFAVLTRRQRLEGAVNDAPLPWLLAAGMVMVILGLASFAVFSGEPAGEGKYVPPVYENGKIIPGHIVRERSEPGQIELEAD